MGHRTASSRPVVFFAIVGVAVSVPLGTSAQSLDWCDAFLAAPVAQASAVASASASASASAVAQPAGATGSVGQASRPPQSKPFRAAISFTEQFQAPTTLPGCPGLQGTVDGQGNASHLGRVQLHSENCAFTPPSGELGFHGADVVLTAANGDLVRARYCGVAVPRQPGSGDNVIVGRYRVTGGTGRFDGAAGSGAVTGTESIVWIPAPAGFPVPFIPYLGQADVVLDGTLAY